MRPAPSSSAPTSRTDTSVRIQWRLRRVRSVVGAWGRGGGTRGTGAAAAGCGAGRCSGWVWAVGEGGGTVWRRITCDGSGRDCPGGFHGGGRRRCGERSPFTRLTYVPATVPRDF